MADWEMPIARVTQSSKANFMLRSVPPLTPEEFVPEMITEELEREAADLALGLRSLEQARLMRQLEHEFRRDLRGEL